MKKSYRFFVLGLLIFNFNCHAQNINLEKVFKGAYSYDNLQNLSWQPYSNFYNYIQEDTIYSVNYKTGEKKILLLLSDIKSLLPGEKITSMPSFKWIDNNRIFFSRLKAIFTLSSKKIQKLPKDDFIDMDLKNGIFVIRDEGYVFVKTVEDLSKSILLCTDTGKNIVFGESVHRSEWGINEGQYFSHSGKYIAFYKMDESMVEDYPLVNVNTPIATYSTIKYPMAGRVSHSVTVGIFDVLSSFAQNKSIFHYIKTDISDGEFLTNITFSNDDKFIYIIHINRSQDHLKLIKYDINTGEKAAVLIEEHNSKYVETSTRPIFLQNDNFIWFSDRSGWTHCYLYSPDGKIVKQLTDGNYSVNPIGLDDYEQSLFFYTSKGKPIDNYVYKLTLRTGKIENLTPKSGTHTAIFNSSKTAFLDYFSNTTTPTVITLIDSNGKIIKELLKSKNPFTDCNLGETKIFTIKNKEGIDLWCRMILPPNFDSSKKYPVLIYVYGGPHSQLVTNNFNSGGIWLQYMAGEGYIVFTLDNRGTAERGADFEKCIHRNLGVKEAEDQMCGVEYLKSLPYVDSKRIGLDGWSYGGFMVLSLATEYPDEFASATCGGPVVDWSKYEVMYGERYMDTPEENPEGYDRSNILNKIDKLKCHLLVIHDAQDHTVVWQHTLQLLNKAIAKNIQLDYFVYPNHDHNVSGIERIHLWNKLKNFHNQWLKP